MKGIYSLRKCWRKSASYSTTKWILKIPSHSFWLARRSYGRNYGCKRTERSSTGLIFSAFLMPYEYAQTKAYIEKQLTYAGHPNAIFSEGRHESSPLFLIRHPRLINLACKSSSCLRHTKTAGPLLMTGWVQARPGGRGFLNTGKRGWLEPSLLLCDKTHRRRTMMSGDDRQNSPSISRQNRPSGALAPGGCPAHRAPLGEQTSEAGGAVGSSMGLGGGVPLDGGLYGPLFWRPAQALDDRTVRLSGTVAEWPQEREYGWSVLVRDGDGRPAVPTLLFADSQAAQLRPGDRVETVAHCTLGRPEPGGGEEITYYTAKGILLTAQGYGLLSWERPEAVPPGTGPPCGSRALKDSIDRSFPGTRPRW